MAQVGSLARSLSQGRRAVVSITAGAAVGQILTLLVSPILARIYQPRDFGIYSVVSAIASTIGVVAAGRLELALPLPENDNDAYSLAICGTVGAAIIGILGGVAVGFYGAAIAGALGRPELSPYLWLALPLAAAMAIFAMLTQLAVREQRYRTIAIRNILQSSTMAGAQVGLSFLGFRSDGLIVGTVFAYATSCLTLSIGLVKAAFKAPHARSASSIKRVLLEYRRFPLFLAPSGLLNVLGVTLPIVMVSHWYGNEVAGWFGLTQKVLAVPAALVGTALSQVYLGELARLIRTDGQDAKIKFMKTSRFLLAAGFFVSLLILLAAPEVFVFCFGSEWAPSGAYARLLALSIGAQLLAVPVSQTLTVLRKQFVQMMWDVGRFVGVLLAVTLPAALGLPVATAIFAFGAVSTVSYLALWVCSYRAICSITVPN